MMVTGQNGIGQNGTDKMVAIFIDFQIVINEENHIVSGSWIAWLINDSIGTILSPTILS